MLPALLSDDLDQVALDHNWRYRACPVLQALLQWHRCDVSVLCKPPLPGSIRVWTTSALAQSLANEGTNSCENDSPPRRPQSGLRRQPDSPNLEGLVSLTWLGVKTREREMKVKNSACSHIPSACACACACFFAQCRLCVDMAMERHGRVGDKYRVWNRLIALVLM